MRTLTIIICSSILFISISVFAIPKKTIPKKKHHSIEQKLKYTKYNFIKNEIAIGYYNRNFMHVKIPTPPSPIFWTAPVKADRGFILMYLRNTYHTRKHFSINLGASVSQWRRHSQTIYAFSAFVMFRFWLFRSGNFQPYILYSIAGPTFLTKNHFGPANLGKKFLWQDILGVGTQIGKTHAINVDVMVVHYSNGDIFYQNTGFGVPIIVSLGYSF